MRRKLLAPILGIALGCTLGTLVSALTPKQPTQPLHDDGVGPLPPPDCVPYPDPIFGCSSTAQPKGRHQ